MTTELENGDFLDQKHKIAGAVMEAFKKFEVEKDF